MTFNNFIHFETENLDFMMKYNKSYPQGPPNILCPNHKIETLFGYVRSSKPINATRD